MCDMTSLLSNNTLWKIPCFTDALTYRKQENAALKKTHLCLYYGVLLCKLENCTLFSKNTHFLSHA